MPVDNDVNDHWSSVAPGFIGSHLVDRLLAEGNAVDVVDDLSSGSLANLAERALRPAAR